MATNARRVLVLLHAAPAGALTPSYRLWHLVETWRHAGHEVVLHAGTAPLPDPRPFDLVVPHIDATLRPPRYAAWLHARPRVINRACVDLSKREVSDAHLAGNSAYDGPMLVKTQANYGGVPERRLLGRPHSTRDVPRDWGRVTWLPPMRYLLVASRDALPPGIEGNPALSLERFVPERSGESYAVRTWTFAGEAESCVRHVSGDAIVKPSASGPPPQACAVPDHVRQARSRLGLDYGKIDFVLAQGRPWVLDATATPGLRDGAGAKQGAVNDALAAGLLALGHGGARGAPATDATTDAQAER